MNNRSSRRHPGSDDSSLRSEPSASEALAQMERGFWILMDENAALLEALKACRSKFEEYAVLHYRKRTAEGDEKALANQRMATLCDEAVAKAERRP